MDININHGAFWQSAGAVTASSIGTTITTGAAHTKGSYTSIDASTPEGIVGFWLFIGEQSSSRFVIDLAVGATPDIVVPDILFNRRTQSGGGAVYFPIALPAGVALQARAQSAGATATIELTVLYKIGNLVVLAACGVVTSYGVSTAATRGTAIDPGATVNTKGSWVQIASATADKHKQIILMIGNGAPTSVSSYNSASWLFDVAIGAASSEQVILSNIPLRRDGSTDIVHPIFIGPLDLNIVSGERLAVRAQCTTNSTANSSDREFDIAILGIT